MGYSPCFQIMLIEIIVIPIPVTDKKKLQVFLRMQFIHDAAGIAFLRGLFESRVMTLAHASVLYFAGKSEAAKKRVQKLKAAGVVRERQRRTYEPSVLFLTSQAFKLLHERGELAAYPQMGIAAREKRARVSEMTLKHELAVMDIKTAVASAIAAVPPLRIAEFTTWPALIQFMASPTPTAPDVVVKPDGFIRRASDRGRWRRL